MQATTVIEAWYLIDFEHDGVDQGVRVAWGIIAEDPSGRWISGDYCCTSPVRDEVTEGDALYAITGNSIYQLIGPGQRITMPANTILALRQGYAPPEIMASKAMHNNQR